jgi:hypothetical protein
VLFSFRGQATHASAVSLARTSGLTNNFRALRTSPFLLARRHRRMDRALLGLLPSAKGNRTKLCRTALARNRSRCGYAARSDICRLPTAMKPAPITNSLLQGRIAALLCVSFGLLFGIGAVSEGLNGGTGSSSSRLSFVHKLATFAFGSHGYAAVLLALSAVLLYSAKWIWKHTPKRPTDRLFR